MLSYILRIELILEGLFPIARARISKQAIAYYTKMVVLRRLRNKNNKELLKESYTFKEVSYLFLVLSGLCL